MSINANRLSSFYPKRSTLFRVVVVFAVVFVLDARSGITVSQTPEALVHGTDLILVKTFFQVSPRFKSASQAIGKLTASVGYPSLWTCTAFLLDSTRIFTARHCLSPESDRYGVPLDSNVPANFPNINGAFSALTQIYVQFDCYDTGEDCQSQKHPIKSVVDFDSSDRLDYVILELSDIVYNRTSLQLTDEIPYQTSYLFQHPDGDGLKLGFPGCRVEKLVADPANPSAVPDDFLTHTCPTKGGSSGGPLMDTSFRVFAFHIQAPSDNSKPARDNPDKEGHYLNGANQMNQAQTISAVLLRSTIARLYLSKKRPKPEAIELNQVARASLGLDSTTNAGRLLDLASCLSDLRDRYSDAKARGLAAQTCLEQFK